MKNRITLLMMAMAISVAGMAQTVLPEVDKSPLDISYYPVNYPLLKIQGKAKEPPLARVIYSRPRKEGRPIFGNLVEYGKLWRLGANEATEIEFYKPVTIGDKKLPKGRYTLFAIVNEKSWTIIFNKDTDVWGSFKYSPAQDAVRIESPVKKLEQSVEMLCMTFEKEENNINLIIAWESIQIAVPLTP